MIQAQEQVLRVATQVASVECVQALLLAKAEPHAADAENFLPLDYCPEHAYSVRQLLVREMVRSQKQVLSPSPSTSP